MKRKRKQTIFAQLLTGFSVILVLLLTTIGYFTYRTSSEVVLDKTSRFLTESVKQMNQKLDILLQEFDTLTLDIGFDPVLQRALQAPGDSEEISTFDIEKHLNQKMRFIGSDVLVLVMGSNERYFSTSSSYYFLWKKTQDILEKEWYQLALSNEGSIHWFSDTVWQLGEKPALVGIRQIRNWGNLEGLGVLMIAVPLETINNQFKNQQDSPFDKIQIHDTYGTIVYSTHPDEIGTPMPQGFLPGKSGDGSGIQYSADTSRYWTSLPSSYSGWNLVAYVKPEEIVGDLNSVQRNIMLIGLFGSLFALALAVFFSWSVARPIRMLSIKLNKTERGSLTPISTRMRNREVEGLFQSFNQMLANLDETILDLSRRQISERQAQLVALKAQFRPHFLYNTLNTIYWTLHRKKLTEESRMVITLSHLLRYSIDGRSELVTLEEDIGQLNRYVYLQQLRYGDKLSVRLDIPAALYSALIMRLLFQPLVENAIVHGLETSEEEHWIIQITGFQEGGLLHLTVEDNGIGMNSDQSLQALTLPEDDADPPDLHTGIGLSNLQNRIRLYYGAEYGISLSDSSLCGLRVDITLPLEIR
ncbi:sensor histidine kinase [Paenibacillus sp. F411]|uniref:cache domain-containing sensor histidine kinase n=1 Tax=Paenibacillus sp. F411 TaxID=2820239 RepID=UPI001AAED91E|nr:sensor histidine kinase [Paenibacillus sp. F411]MBO2944360.1 sensor histidine kinase [Paenibacillus sp. F411]